MHYAMWPNMTSSSGAPFYPQLSAFIEALESPQPDTERREALDDLAAWIRTGLETGGQVSLTFICTHNSRRSHLAQIWMAAMARYYGLEGVVTFSGGTEATSFNPRAVASLRRSGFHITEPGGDNPRYAVYMHGETDPLICFSKKYDHPENPSQGFAAVMVCSDADENCPVVFGAAARFALPYPDPKDSDGLADEAATYDLRCRQIAVEMQYVALKAASHA